jgi:(Z)-2-((N-methylformamido)methylene)-5-hydroxybutyrolactone dehydrogenase
MTDYKMLIDGNWVDAVSGERFETSDPYTREVWATIPRGGAADAEQAVDAAWRALKSGPWSKMSATARGELLHKLADLMLNKAQELAEFEVRDNGKLIAEMGAQMRYAPKVLRYFAGLADKIEGTVPPIENQGLFVFTRNEPIGVVVAITPWNSPLMLTIYKIAPALAAGCTVIIKPSEYTSASTLEFAKLAELAGFPPGVINVVTGYGAEVGEPLVAHRKVAKITFTGGEPGGRSVAVAAAQDFKPVTLELGGKSPNIVFDDADLSDAVKGAVSGIFAASGQTCIAGSRLLVQESIHDEFLDKLVAFAGTAKLGDPSKLDTQVGPVTTPPQYQKILSYIDIAKKEGARCVLGGGPSELGGYFVQPTIFADVNNKMRIAQEEVFGPVLSVIKFKDEEDAIQIANDTLYGLASGVWTRSMKRAFDVSSRIEAGTVWVNTYRQASASVPFGGYKRSGHGRENGLPAIRSFMQTKTVWMNYGADVPNPFIIRV